MTKKTDLIQPDRGQDATAIHLVNKDGFEAWAKGLSGPQRAALAAQKFEGGGYQVGIVPDGDGWFAVGGVAARNGIMMISHYLHLMKHEGEGFTDHMIERGTLERFVPVTMTALSAGIALIPFVISMGEPGKEILSPVAICIVGGLISSTLLDFAVTPAVFRLFGRKAAAQALALQAPATH